MANTYTLIASNTLGSDTASITFSSIPSTYTDLVLKASIRTTRSSSIDFLAVQFNSDTATNYSRITLGGSGSGYSSEISSSATYLNSGHVDAASATASTFSNTELYIPSYNSTSNKPLSTFNAQENNNLGAYISSIAGLYRGSSGISSIYLYSVNATNFVSGSSFFLYGIKNS
jgi:hypothetical protein